MAVYHHNTETVTVATGVNRELDLLLKCREKLNACCVPICIDDLSDRLTITANTEGQRDISDGNEQFGT